MVKSAATIKADVARVGRPRKPSTRVTPEMIAELVRLYAKGKSLRECAAKTDVAYGTARRKLLAAGVVLRPPGGAPS
jgi:Helix-turn-helix domain